MIPIYMIVSDDIVAPASVAMVSILKNTNSFINFILLEKNSLPISRKNIKKIYQLKKIFPNFSVDIITINVDEFKNLDLSKEKYVPVDTFFRYKIPNLKSNIAKAIYLDIDVVCNKDISSLYDFDLKQHMLGVVRNEKGKFMTPTMEKVISKTGIKNPYNYFNAGVLLFNCELCRKNNITEKLFLTTQKNKGKIDYADQDVLNIVFENSNIELPGEYNTYPSRINENDELPTIIHFVGSNKPWKKKCLYDFVFWQYAKISPFYRKLKKNREIDSSNSIIKKIYILGVSVLKIVKRQSTIKFKLFNFIPVLGVKRKAQSTKLYFCNIPIIKIKRKELND